MRSVWLKTWIFCGLSYFYRTKGDFMSLINIENLSFGYDGDYEMVFENIDLQL